MSVLAYLSDIADNHVTVVHPTLVSWVNSNPQIKGAGDEVIRK